MSLGISGVCPAPVQNRREPSRLLTASPWIERGTQDLQGGVRRLRHPTAAPFWPLPSGRWQAFRIDSSNSQTEPSSANSNDSSSTVLISGNRGMVTWAVAGQDRGDTPRSPSQTPRWSENFGPLGVAVFVPFSNSNGICGSSRPFRTDSAV